MTDRCPCCRRKLADVGPLPRGTLRMCPCRSKPAFAPPQRRRSVAPDDGRLRLRLAGSIDRLGPLMRAQLSCRCAVTPERMAGVLAGSGWFAWLDGRWSLTAEGREGLAAATEGAAS